MIVSIDLQRLRNGEFSQFLQDILKIIIENDPLALQVQSQYNRLFAVAAEIESLFKLPTGSTVTAELEHFDLLRDNALKGISSIVRGYIYSEDPVVKNHAILLDDHFALFSNIITDSYQSQTSSIRNIIEDWGNKPALTAAITALNLNSWQTNLENANNSFATKYLQRAVEPGSNNADTLKTKRIQANEAYYKLRNALNAHYEITEAAEPYKTVVASVNGLINNYNEMLKRRVGGK